MELPKVKVRTGITEDDLSRIREANIKKLKQKKAEGASKEKLYLNFPKVFVDKYY